jgi:hypothetical protein
MIRMLSASLEVLISLLVPASQNTIILDIDWMCVQVFGFMGQRLEHWMI